MSKQHEHKEPIDFEARLVDCPQCGLRFNDWFFWPGKGNYCWPCYHNTGQVYVRIEKGVEQ